MTNFMVFQYIVPQLYLAIGSHYHWPFIQPLQIPRVVLPPELLKNYCGKFSTAAGDSIQINLEKDHLTACSSLFYHLPLDLTVVGENQFLAPLAFTRIGFTPDLQALTWDGTEAKRETS